jgi:hypothetical protein
MAHLVALKNALVTQIGLSWADVKPNGIFLSNQLLQIDFSEQARDGSLPIAVLDFRQTGVHEYGSDPGRDVGPITISRVIKDSETMDTLIGKLETLRQAFWDDWDALGLAVKAQLLTYPTVDFSFDQPLQRFFFETAKPLVCGSVMLTIEVQDA